MIFCAFVSMRNLWRDRVAQDLIEYALVAVLIALGSAAAMSSIAASINAGFVSVGSKLVNYTS